MQGGTEDIQERIMSLHTEMCESGEVTSVEEEHDSATWPRFGSVQEASSST